MQTGSGYRSLGLIGALLIAACLTAGCSDDDNVELDTRAEPNSTGSSGENGSSSGGNTGDTSELDMRCDEAVYPSAEWTACEAENYARVLEAPAEELASPAFLARMATQSQANLLDYIARGAADPSWLLASSPALVNLLDTVDVQDLDANALDALFAAVQDDPSQVLSVSANSPLTPLCAAWALPCVGDPFRYPDVAGADGDAFYTQQAQVEPVVFYDRGCARLSGRVWRPAGAGDDASLPGIVIDNGSLQASETLYWWAAQLLVRNGYVVMTFDPRGQGRSNMQTPSGEQGSNANIEVFWTGLVDAIDFFRSTPTTPYPHNQSCAGSYPTEVTGSNPFFASIDAGRLGIAGHSADAAGVSVVQGYDTPASGPWPGQLDDSNPVDVVVARDDLTQPGGETDDTRAGTSPDANVPDFGARVPALDMVSEYGLTPTPFTEPPDPEAHKIAYNAWRAAELPVYTITIRGSSHYEWSLLPAFPATSWCPAITNGACDDANGWGNIMAQHYTLAWFDRWLKQPGEPGYATADTRLLDDDGPHGRVKMSFRYHSARSFPTRAGADVNCEDIRAGCDAS